MKVIPCILAQCLTLHFTTANLARHGPFRRTPWVANSTHPINGSASASGLASASAVTAYFANLTPTSMPPPTPTPYFTPCSDPMCPGLNNELCLDASEVTYSISCGTVLTGVVLTTAESASLEACMALCDDLGCVGVSYGFSDLIRCRAFSALSGSYAANGTISASVK